MSLEQIKQAHKDICIQKRLAVRREEFLDYMTFKANIRPLFIEFLGPLIGMKENWKAQGATPGELDFSAFEYRSHLEGRPNIVTGFFGGQPEKLLEENQRFIIYRDEYGRTMKYPKGIATIAHPMDYPVKDMNDWLKIKHHYEFTPKRLAKDWEKQAHEFFEVGRVITVKIPGGFDEPRQLMGEENLCLSYYQQPELIHEMLNTIGETAFKVLDIVSSRVQVDMLFVHEDMAGKSGPLAGPAQINEFIKPYYRKIWDMLKKRGARLFSQDSDGNMDPVIDVFLDAGVNLMFPMEPAAGMDIVKTREKYGNKLAFIGGIDKFALQKSKEDITAELEYKIPPIVKTGGCVLGLDHRIPAEVPLKNYRFYIEKAWEIMEREG